MSSNCQEPSLVAEVRPSPWEICNSNDFIRRGETDMNIVYELNETLEH